MKRLIAALIAALAVPVAYAQNPAASPEATPPAAATPTTQPATTPVPKGPENLVAEPTASASLAEGPDAERVKPIVEALNAEPSLKASKITVATDQDVVFLTGVTLSDAQRKRAMEIATQFAGEGKVANAITTEQLIVRQPGAS
jgi:hypothetical protein